MSGAVLTISKEDDLGLALASGVALPPVIARAGKRAAERLIEFFTAHIRNAHTRRAYGRVAWNFFAWIDERDVALEGITAVHVAAVVSCPQSAKAAIPTGFSCGSSTFCHGSRAGLFWHFWRGPHSDPEADLARMGSRENRHGGFRP